MNVKQLQYFLVVAEEKQITSAAKRLYMAQPPLSYQLKQLEKELNVKLFTRTSHGIELTDAGKMLQNYALRIVNLVQTAEDKIQQTVSGRLGTLSIGCVSSSYGCFPGQQLHSLKKYYPEISFSIHEDNTYGIIEKLNNKIIDLGIVRTPFNQQGFSVKELSSEKMVAVVNEEFSNDKNELKIQDLAGQPLIIYRRFEELFSESFAHAGLSPFYAVKCDDSRTAINWAEQGMGIALVPESIAKIYAKSKVIPINHVSWQTKLVLIWRKNEPMTELQKMVIEKMDK